jgi:hypothetical protein
MTQEELAMPLLDDYYSDPELADDLGVTIRTTKSWRDKRTGPPVTYIKGKPYYRKVSAREWLLSREGKHRGAA